MTTPMPTLFLSHGAPDLVLSDHVAVDAMRQIVNTYEIPRAIVVISAHWISRDKVAVSSSATPETIHDFGNFGAELYQLRYPAPGDPQLAAQIVDLLKSAGLQATTDAQRGLDHGAWMPLLLMYPQADIPVVQISLPGVNPDACLRLGQAIAELRNEGILVIGSGGTVHNLRLLHHNNQPEAWAESFADWLIQAVEGNRIDLLLDAEEQHPLFRKAHPTTDHFVPLLVAWGAADPTRPGKRFHHSFTYGNLGMSSFLFA